MKQKTIRKRKIRFDYEFGHGEWAALKVCATRMDKTLEEFLRYLVHAEINLAIRDYRECGETEMTDEEKDEFYKKVWGAGLGTRNQHLWTGKLGHSFK